MLVEDCADERTPASELFVRPSFKRPARRCRRRCRRSRQRPSKSGHFLHLRLDEPCILQPSHHVHVYRGHRKQCPRSEDPRENFCYWRRESARRTPSTRQDKRGRGLEGSLGARLHPHMRKQHKLCAGRHWKWKIEREASSTREAVRKGRGIFSLS